MHDIILHHYPASPVSELVRIALGIKQLAWKSVIIPMVAPKPELTPLTGGYRKTPVLQIGADVYCDSHRIVDALEAQAPQPSLFAPPPGALARTLCQWTGGPMFRAAAVTALEPVADTLPQAFWDDRKALFGMEKAAMVAAAPHLKTQFTAGMQLISEQLADGRDYLGGSAPGYADCAAYMLWWFGSRSGSVAAQAFAERSPMFNAWAGRVKAIGHGTPSDMAASDAIAVARDARSLAQPHVIDGLGFAAGAAVAVLTEDPGATPVSGALLILTDAHIALKRHDPAVGEVVVHFPRLGYRIEAA
jgi:glutathione S-transferase